MASRPVKIAEKKTATALAQIEALQQQKREMDGKWLEMGMDKWEAAYYALGDQIVALYEEVDALREGLCKLPSKCYDFHKRADKASSRKLLDILCDMLKATATAS